MTAFLASAARPVAFVLALAATAGTLSGVDALSRHEYQRAVVAQAARAAAAQPVATNAASGATRHA